MNNKRIYLFLIIITILLTIPSCLKERRVSILKIKQKDIINTAEKQLGKSIAMEGKVPHVLIVAVLFILFME